MTFFSQYGDEHPDDEPIRHEFMKQFKKSEENVKMTPDQITSKLSQLKQGIYYSHGI